MDANTKELIIWILNMDMALTSGRMELITKDIGFKANNTVRVNIVSLNVNPERDYGGRVTSLSGWTTPQAPRQEVSSRQ